MFSENLSDTSLSSSSDEEGDKIEQKELDNEMVGKYLFKLLLLCVCLTKKTTRYVCFLGFLW